MWERGPQSFVTSYLHLKTFNTEKLFSPAICCFSLQSWSPEAEVFQNWNLQFSGLTYILQSASLPTPFVCPRYGYSPHLKTGKFLLQIWIFNIFWKIRRFGKYEAQFCPSNIGCSWVYLHTCQHSGFLRELASFFAPPGFCRHEMVTGPTPQNCGIHC